MTAVMRELDEKESDLVRGFVSRGCSCDFGPWKTPCSMLFPLEHYQSLRATFTEMSNDELGLYVMGQSSTLQGHHSSSPEQRKGMYGQFYHHGQRVCHRTFLFLHNIGIKRFNNIKKSYLQNGPAVRVHGNTGKTPKHHLTLQQVKDIVQYILNYTGRKNHDIMHVHTHNHMHAVPVTEANVMVLPGRVPGYKLSDIQLLPSSTTKHNVWELYQQAAAVGSTRPVYYSMFTFLWRQLLPHVVVMKPMSDLCWLCQQNSSIITRSANRPEQEKTQVHSIAVATPQELTSHEV